MQPHLTSLVVTKHVVKAGLHVFTALNVEAAVSSVCLLDMR
jgi:hypothetical protein